MRSNRVGKERQVFGLRLVLTSMMAALTLGFCFASTATASSPKWSPPVKADSAGALHSVSCVSDEWCMAVDQAGNALLYDGSTWSVFGNIAEHNGLLGVSCTSETFCVAVGWGGVATTYNGSTWSTPVEASPYRLTAVSCVSDEFCAAVGEHGYASTFNGSTWSTAVQIANGFLESVSCVSSAWCVATYSDGYVTFYNGSTWSSPAQIEAYGTGLKSVSCTSTTFCMAVTDTGNAVKYNGSTWSTYADIDPYKLYGVSCVSPAFCMAVDDVGYALMFNGSSWSTPVQIDEGANDLESVSCVSEEFCVAVDYRAAGGGNVMYYRVEPALTNVTLPAITGSAKEGQTLTEIQGSWSATPAERSYQWGRCDVSGHGCQAISGQTAQTYLLSAADVGHTIRATETAWNAEHVGTPVTSEPTAVVQAASEPVLTNVSPPSITGKAEEGQTLNELQGTWSATPAERSYQWERCVFTGPGCSPISGATSPSYTLTAADVGHTLRVAETAWNAEHVGTSATSAQTTLVAEEPEPEPEPEPEHHEETQQPGNDSGGHGPTHGDSIEDITHGNSNGDSGRLNRHRACVVPNLKHKTLKQAKRLLKRHHCRLGKVKVIRPKHHRWRHRRHKLKVVRQMPGPRQVRHRGFRVSVRLR